jgi:signal transduction histidine kinase/CheY-like chemotaxis protein
MKDTGDASLARAMAATGAGVWEWHVDRPEALRVQWGGAGEFRDIRAGIDDEDWRLLVSRLQQAVLDDAVFQDSVSLQRTVQDTQDLQLLGARVAADGAGWQVSGLCWMETADRDAEDQALWAPLAKLSHELRSPLAGVTEQVREAKSKTDDARIREALDEAHASCVYMQRLIQDMLVAFRAGEADAPGSPEAVYTQRLLGQLMPFVADLAERKGLRLDVAQEDDFPECFLAEPVALRRILQNLLDNAVKYTDTGYIDVRLQVASDDGVTCLCFEVEDSGQGMSEDEIARVFLPFARGRAGSGRPAGLGIGLALSHQLALSLDGRLEVESRPGQGSVFRLLLPARVPPATAGDTGQDAMTVVVPGTRVLLVDDHPLLSKLTGRSLSRLGCEVAIVASGGEALRRLAEYTPDVIILDLDLPDMSGCDLCRQLRGRDQLCDCRFVAYSGSDEAYDRQAAAQAGFDAYFVKPTPAEELLGS